MPKQLDPRMIDSTKDVTFAGTRFVTPSGGSDLWNTTSNLVQTNSALWEETQDILPTVTNYLSTNSVQISSLSLSAITFTNRFTTATSLTATTTVIEVRIDGIPKYLPLFDIN